MNGIIGKKLSMARLFTEGGKAEAVTAIEAGPCTVTQVKTAIKDGYNAVQLGFGTNKKVKSPKGEAAKGLKQFKYLREFDLGEGEKIEVGQKIDVSLFKAGDVIDVIGISKGKGFAGVVKRHHFKGGPKTHGQSDRHRAPGSIGATTTPGRVIKGMRMGGHMGDQRVTARNLKVFRADAAKNLLLVTGAVPGASNGLLMIRKVEK